MKWADVFKKAVMIAKEIRKKNPNLTYAQAVKKAWATPEMKALKEEYKKKKGSSDSVGGRARRGRPRGTTTRRSTTTRRKPATRKRRTTVKRKTTVRKRTTVRRRRTV